MWFRNLSVYRLPQGWSMSAAEIEQHLTQRCLMPCGRFDMRSRGWTQVGDTERYVYTINGQHLIALGVDEKVLPAAVIRQATAERAKETAAEQGYPVGRRQMRELKAKITEELRGRAVTRKRVTRAWIDPVKNWLVVDAASAARAEELVENLRDAVGSLQMTPLDTERSPASVLTSWVMLGDAPQSFSIDDDLELQAADQSKPTIRYVRHALDGKQIRDHIQAGMFATRLGLTWRDRVSFVLNEKLQIRRVEFLHVESGKPDDSAARSAAEQFDADFTLMTGEFGELLADLVAAIGGTDATASTEIAPRAAA